VCSLFRYLTGNKGIQPGCGRLFDITLGSSAAPSHSLNPVTTPADMQRLSLQRGSDSLAEQFRRLLAIQDTCPEQAIILIQRRRLGDTQLNSQPAIVAQFPMGIQGQMVGHKTDAVLHQGAHPVPLDAGQHRRLTLPEITVMDQQQVCLVLHRCFQ